MPSPASNASTTTPPSAYPSVRGMTAFSAPPSTIQTLPRSCTADSGSTSALSCTGPAIETSTNEPGSGSVFAG